MAKDSTCSSLKKIGYYLVIKFVRPLLLNSNSVSTTLKAHKSKATMFINPSKVIIVSMSY